MSKSYERKKCDKCSEWADMYYGDAGQLCYYCSHWLGTQYKVMRVWLVLKKLEPIGWIVLALAIWNYRELIDLYNYTCMLITNTFYSTVEILKSWMFFSK